MSEAQIVGRDLERGTIERWLDVPRPSCLVIDGEAGIGKSTLWDFTLDHAAGRHERILSWRATIAEQGMAFAALTALLDDPSVLDALPVLARPRRRALEAAMARVDPGPQAPEPGMVGLAVSDVLRGAAAAAPLVIAIDDLQWLDAPSEDALAFAARRLHGAPIGFVLARRTGAPLGGAGHALATPAGARSELARAVTTSVPPERCERLEVGPLSVGALGRLINERFGVTHPRPLLVRIHDACRGNPFVALEMSRSLTTRSLEPGPGEPFPVPPEVEPLIRDHLAALSPDARRSLLIAVVSADPSLGLVERLLGSVAGDAVDEACRKGVLVADGSRLRVTHPLYASTAYADAQPGELRALRQSLGAIVDDPVERGIHLAATIDGKDDEAAESVAEAGRIAFGRGAPGVAAGLLERAANVAQSADRRTAMLIEAADGAVGAGDPARAEAALRTVLDEVPGGARRAEALLALGEIVYVERPTEALALLVSALDHTDGRPELEAMVHSHIASMADMDPPTGYRSALAAVDILQQAGVDPDPDHLACALLDRAFHWLLKGERVAADDIDRGIALMSKSGNSFPSRRAQELAERCSFHLGRLSEAIAFDQAEYRRLTERGEVGLMPPLLQSLSVLTLMSGDWDAARRLARECMDLVEQGEEAWRERALTARARILAWEGDLDPARAIAVEALAREEASGDLWEGAIFCALLGFIELSVPDPAAALRYLTRALDHTDAMQVVLPTQFRFLGDFVEAAVLAGNFEVAEQVLVERLEKPAQRLPLPWILAMAARGRGFLTAAQGELAGAIRWFDRASEIFDDALPMPFERARTLLARGQVNRRAGHRRAARENVNAALSIFESLGARAWAGRARDEVGRIAGRASSALTLTTSERAVVELAATGRSNREIAAELIVSIRTVESQLSAAYRKLDVRSRGQLRAALATADETIKG